MARHAPTQIGEYMNPLASATSQPRALLVLEDGTTFEGRCCGASGETFGEIVFNTSMTGYQEIISDPSYAGQIVTLTYPQVGNYGIDPAVMQRDVLHLRGFVVHDMCYEPSNWTSKQSLPEFLQENGVVAIEGINTRALTMHLRDHGAQKAAISTEDLDPAHLLARVQASPSISEHNFVPDVSVDILQGLAANGCEVTVVPWNTPAKDALAYNPDGIFFSNGPGDPEQVDATQEAARGVLGKVPVFGICLGNQMLSIVAGADIEKLKFGHHGGNEPVMNLLTGKVEITAQNHNYGLVFPSLGKLIAEESGGISEHFDNLCEWSARRIAPVVQTKEFGRVRLTHVNLNDGTPEGIQFLDIPAFSVQYHPEASPGPHDSSYLFKAFARLMEGQSDYLAIDVREGRRF